MTELIQNDAGYQKALADNTGGSPYFEVDWDGVKADLNEAHLDAADAKYLDGASDLDVQDDQDAREALDDSAHAAVENDELGTDLNTNSATVGGAAMPVYAGGNIVDSDDYDAFKRGVFDAVQAGNAFELSGQVPPDGAESEGDFNTDHVDPLMLIEASKLTGEKHF